MRIKGINPYKQPEIDQPQNQYPVMQCTCFLLQEQCCKEERVECRYQEGVFHTSKIVN